MKFLRFFLGFACSLLLNGCYSFTGASISPDVKTIEIPTVIDESGGPAFLSIRFSERTRNYFLQNTNLKLVKSNGDLLIDAVIVSYVVTPAAFAANNVAAQNRLTIGVKVTYENNKDDTHNFKDQMFTQFRDFPPNQNLAQVESDLTDQIFDLIVTDLFNKTVANW
ncbi:MAG: LPS assembly lipoprotein LptE [Cytophagales bacterium]